ncbi:hypothetical protein [Haliangium sp.]|uniref:hypothetical protein n=1 Tax=Haliangium sp. TaxID=2663208 RepID=UPI003D0A1FC9
MTRLRTLVAIAMLCAAPMLAGCSGTPGPDRPSVDGECVISEGIVLFRSLLTTTYEAPDGSSATTYSYWDVLCWRSARRCNGEVTVLGETGGIAQGERTAIRDAELRRVESDHAVMEWDGALVLVHLAERAVHYEGFSPAVILGTGKGSCD